MLQEFFLRGIKRAVINRHLDGDLIKFYGVAGTDFFYWFYPFENNHSKLRRDKAEERRSASSENRRTPAPRHVRPCRRRARRENLRRRRDSGRRRKHEHNRLQRLAQLRSCRRDSADSPAM